MPSQRLDSLLPGLVESPTETRSIECKQGLLWREAKHKVARAALGLANTRDGGFIVIGVTETEDKRLEPTGLTEEQRATYNQDDIAAFVSSFGSEPMELSYSEVKNSGMMFGIIEVSQFRSNPIIARKGSPDTEPQGVRANTLYVRPYGGKPESKPANADELAEVIDLAVELKLRAYVETTARAGLILSVGAQPGQAGTAAATPDDLYAAEAGDL